MRGFQRRRRRRRRRREWMMGFEPTAFRMASGSWARAYRPTKSHCEARLSFASRTVRGITLVAGDSFVVWALNRLFARSRACSVPESRFARLRPTLGLGAWRQERLAIGGCPASIWRPRPSSEFSSAPQPKKERAVSGRPLPRSKRVSPASSRSERAPSPRRAPDRPA